jgi:leader peptidase (prepilin peptidase)/N-methyltransferase
MRQAATTVAAIGGGLALLAAGVRTGGDGIELARVVILGAALGAVVATDISEHRIPNRIVVPAALVCTGLLAVEAVPPQRLLGGIALVALMLALSLVQPASLGMGDVKLALLVVLGLGALATRALVLGLVIAAAFGAVLVLRHGRVAARRSVPLAPFLCGGAALAVLL